MNTKKYIFKHVENNKLLKISEVEIVDGQEINLVSIDLRLFKDYRSIQILQDDLLVELNKSVLENLYEFLKENWNRKN